MKKKTTKKKTIKEKVTKESYWSYRELKTYTREEAIVRNISGVDILCDSLNSPLMIRL